MGSACTCLGWLFTRLQQWGHRLVAGPLPPLLVGFLSGISLVPTGVPGAVSPMGALVLHLPWTRSHVGLLRCTLLLVQTHALTSQGLGFSHAQHPTVVGSL